MGRIFFSDNLENRVFNRTARGYTKIVLDSELKNGDNYEIILNKEDKIIYYNKIDPATDRNSGEILIICKEFTAYDRNNNIEVILCDNGVMFVALLNGFIKYTDYSSGDEFELRTFDLAESTLNYKRKNSGVVTANSLRSTVKWWLDGFSYIDDFAYNTIIDVDRCDTKGSRTDLGSNITITYKQGDTPFFDLSLGVYDKWLEKQKQKKLEEYISEIRSEMEDFEDEYTVFADDVEEDDDYYVPEDEEDF